MKTAIEGITVTKSITVQGEDAIIGPCNLRRDRPAVIHRLMITYRFNFTVGSYESVDVSGFYLRKDGSVSGLRATFSLFGDDLKEYPWVAALIEEYRPGLDADSKAGGLLT